MDSNCSSSDQVITKLVEMGFEHSVSEEAIKEVGPSMVDAVDFILNKSHTNNKATSSSYKHPAINKKVLGKRALTATRGSMRQTSIMEHLQPKARSKRSRTNDVPDVSVTGSETLPEPVEERMVTLSDVGLNPSLQPFNCPQGVDVGADWEHKANSLLRKHFGYSSLKSFQIEALSAWVAHQDCLVLAATGSGKSLCFQIPALLSGKVVVVISPLISLMHDQCLKLSKHGISACFLGSGQPDSSVEQKAMRGMYGIIYVCPETILRLIEPLQRLAENRGIALFAIDEVHCVSKWGHDFRPDYRRLSVLRKTFSACKLNFLKFNIPLMALTATATLRVREDILKSLSMLKETKIVVTSFFRPNLRFEVKHSRTSSPSSYETDFCQLIDIYTKKRKNVQQKQKHNMEDTTDGSSSIANGSISEEDVVSLSDVDDNEDSNSDENDDEENSRKENHTSTSMDKQMSVEYLEDEADDFPSVDDWDVACAEFQGQSLAEDRGLCGLRLPKTLDPPINPEERLKLLQGPLEHGPTIIYVPTRKQTLSIAKYLCRFGIKAAAYNASLPKSHLRQVHKDFHENALEVIVATIAFGMGIDKLNVRRIIHYGWPQSLEAYYQEAGRAGRDGKLADCVLYANLSRMPSLLPNKRSEEQTKQSYKMLSDCYRYGMNTSCCRAKILVEYFGEEFADQKCLLCDVCVNGPPERENLKEEADILLQIIAAYYEQRSCVDYSYEDATDGDTKQRRSMDKPDIRMFVSKIREQFPKFTATDQLWWRGLSRILENKGYIREADDKIHVMIKFPEPTKLGHDFLQCKSAEEGTFYVYPEADMLLSMKKDKPYSTFADWGKGWADPEIRRQRLGSRQSKRKPRQRKSRKRKDPNTVRGRLTSKLSKCK